MLFKKSKNPFNNEPTTPKLKLRVLSPMTPPPASTHIFAVHQEKSHDQPSSRRSSGHRSGLGAGYATDSGYTRTRERKSSMRMDNDDICKPANPKSRTASAVTATGAMPPQAAEAGLEKPAKPAGWIKSAMKGGSYYLPSGRKHSPSSSSSSSPQSNPIPDPRSKTRHIPPRSRPDPHPEPLQPNSHFPSIIQSAPSMTRSRSHRGTVPPNPHDQTHVAAMPNAYTHPHSGILVLPLHPVVSSDPYQRVRQQSLPGRQHSYHAQVANPGNYVDPYVRPSPKPEPDWAKTPARLNWPLVEYEKRRGDGTPLLLYDIGFDPDLNGYEVKANRYPCNTKLTREERNLPVSSDTFLTEMTIICPGLERWPVIVRASKGGLRCIDVFREIYNTFSKTLTREESYYLVTPDIRERVERHFKQRCKDGPQLALYEERMGLCRVDLLRGRRQFNGLTPHPAQRDVWILNIPDSLNNLPVRGRN